MAYDDYAMQDQRQQMEMQNAMRQRMQQMGGVTPMNFNPDAQGVRGFAPSFGGMQGQEMAARNQMQNSMQQYGSSMDASNAGVTDMERNAYAQNMAGQQPMAPPPESMAPQMPAHMAMQRQRMMQQRANVNKANMVQGPGAAAGAPPDMAAYRANKTMPDFAAMRNAASGMGTAMGRTPPNLNPAAVSKPARVAAGLGAAGSAMGLANQQRNKAKMAVKKKPAMSRTPGTVANKPGGMMQEPPTF